MPKKLILQPYAKRQLSMIRTLVAGELFKHGFSQSSAKLKGMDAKRVIAEAVFADKGQHQDIIARFTLLVFVLELVPQDYLQQEFPFPHE